jgi:hypothetical protein
VSLLPASRRDALRAFLPVVDVPRIDGRVVPPPPLPAIGATTVVAANEGSLPSPPTAATAEKPPSKKKTPSTRQKNINKVITTGISEWARVGTTFGDKIKNNFTTDEFDKWEKQWVRQIRSRFQDWSVNSKDLVDNIGLGLRSDTKDDIFVDDDARLCRVTDIRRLSRYHFEDILRVQADGRLVLYFLLNRKGTNVDSVFLTEPFHRKNVGSCIGSARHGHWRCHRHDRWE